MSKETVAPDKPVSSSRSAPRFPFAVDLIPKLKRSPLGALMGLVITGIVTLLTGTFPARPWLEVPIALICVPGCMFIDRLLDWRFSGKVDARMRHAAAHEDARIALDKLEDFQKRGIINKPDAHKIADHIAKRDVAGGPRQPRARGPYKKRAHLETPTDPAGPSDPPTPMRPAA